MSQLKFDFNNMMSSNVGSKHGVTDAELGRIKKISEKAHKHLSDVAANEKSRINLGLEWTRLPYQSDEFIAGLQRLGDEIADNFENVLFLGIGGSYLGLKAAQDALCPAYYNEFQFMRKGRPRIYFEGNNLDPNTLSVLLNNLNPKSTYVVVISKSGETTETKAAFELAEQWLKKGSGDLYGRQIFAITDPESGTLRKKVNAHQSKDQLAFKNLPLLKGVGGRFSEFNMGLLHLAIIGVDIKEVLSGARDMARRCAQGSLLKNPAYLYAALQTILYKKKGKFISVVMPFSETLKSSADWYIQMLAESLGKKYGRVVLKQPDGSEKWVNNLKKIVNVGRTPISARGTNDLHSIQQNNIEGENNKTVTFIKVAKFTDDLKLPVTGDIISGRKYSELINIAQEATEWALVREARPNCTIVMDAVTPYSWGELLYFFEFTTAFEGELLDVNAFDQPGVEGYKNYMYVKLKKPGLAPNVVKEINNNPLKKNKKYII